MQADDTFLGLGNRIREHKKLVANIKRNFVRDFNLPNWILDDEKLQLADRTITSREEKGQRRPLFDLEHILVELRNTRAELRESNNLADERTLALDNAMEELRAAESLADQTQKTPADTTSELQRTKALAAQDRGVWQESLRSSSRRRHD